MQELVIRYRAYLDAGFQAPGPDILTGAAIKPMA
jgi:hypothetical protein